MRLREWLRRDGSPHPASPPAANHGEAPLYLFHVPKTGGTTVGAWLERRFHPEEVCAAHHVWELVRESPSELRRYRLFRGHFGYGLPGLIGGPVRHLIVVRDPVEHVLSWFTHMRRDPASNRLHRLIADRAPTLADALASEEIAPLLANPQTRWIASDEVGGGPQPGGESGMLERALERVDGAFWVGVLERLPEAMSALASRLGTRPVGFDERRNVSAYRIRRSELPSDVVARLEEMTAIDRRLYEVCDAEVGRRVTTEAEERYEERRRAETPRAEIRFDMREPVFLHGWHDWERGRDGRFLRWTGPGTRAELDVRLLPARGMALAMRVAYQARPDLLDSLVIRVNEQLVPWEPVKSRWEVGESGETLRGAIPYDCLARSDGVVRIVLEVAETTRPADGDGDGDDQRQLGIAVEWIELFHLK